MTPRPTRLDHVAADEQLIEDLRARRVRPGDALAELLGAWLTDIDANDPDTDGDA